MHSLRSYRIDQVEELVALREAVTPVEIEGRLLKFKEVFDILYPIVHPLI